MGKVLVNIVLELMFIKFTIYWTDDEDELVKGYFTHEWSSKPLI